MINNLRAEVSMRTAEMNASRTIIYTYGAPKLTFPRIYTAYAYGVHTYDT